MGGFVSSEGFLRFQGLDEQQQQHEGEAIVESELLDFLCNTHTHPRTPGCHLPFAFLSLFLLLYSSQQRSSYCCFPTHTSEKKLLYGLRILGGGRTL